MPTEGNRVFLGDPKLTWSCGVSATGGTTQWALPWKVARDGQRIRNAVARPSLLLLLGGLLALARRQAFQIDGDGGAVCRGQFRGVGHHFGHVAGDAGTVGCEAGFEEELEILDRPGRQPVRVWSDVGHKAALTFRVRATGKPRRGVDAAQAVAAAVALGAMPRPFDEVSTAIVDLVHRRAG